MKGFYYKKSVIKLVKLYVVINIPDPTHFLLTSGEDVDWRAIAGEARPALELPGRPGHKDSHHLLPEGRREKGGRRMGRKDGEGEERRR